MYCSRTLMQPKKPDATHVTLLSLVREAYRESQGSAGARSIAAMVSIKGIKLSRWRAAKLMKELNIISCQQPDHRYKKASKEHIKIPNYLDRQFAVTEPNQVWCGDVTYIWAGSRWAYLAVVLNLFSRRPIGWAMSLFPDSALTGKALSIAWEAREKSAGFCITQIKAAITNYITVYYSQLRPHQYNGGLTPNESERLFWENSKTVASFY